MSSPIRVLVTGFGPFPGVPDNASASVVNALAGTAVTPGIELFAEVVPVDWADARTAAACATARANPHAILHFGVSKRVTGFEIETRAINMSGPKQDAAGIARPESPLDRYGMPLLPGTLPPSILLRALRQGRFPVQLSRNAGRYLCNALFYWSLAEAGASGALVGFIHLPALGAEGVQPRLTLNEAIAGAKVLVRASSQAVLVAKRNCIGSHGGRNSHGSQAFYGARWGSRRLIGAWQR